MNKEIKDEEVDKLLEDELFREAKMIEKSLLGDHADEPSVSDEEIDKVYAARKKRRPAKRKQPGYTDSRNCEISRIPGNG